MKTCMASVGTTKDGYVFPIRCKKWSCPVCSKLNAYRHAIKVANACQAIVSAGVIPKFVTITQPGNVKTARYAYSILHSQWDGFRNRLQYWARTDAGVPVWYAAFVEGQPHRELMPHFHIIMSACPKPSDLTEMVVSSGFGFECKVEPFQTQSGVAWYVAKYATKAEDAMEMPKGFRRVRYSEGWPGMRFRVDETDKTAIVKGFKETYLEWLDRCQRAGVDADTLERNLMLLLEQSAEGETEFDRQRAEAHPVRA